MLLHLTEIFIFSFLVLLSFIMIANPLKVNKKANFWLGISLMLWATFWLDEVLILTGSNTLDGTLALLMRIIQFLAPIVFYLSFLFFTNPNYNFDIKSLSFLILPFFYITVLIYDNQTANDLQYLSIGLIIIHTLFYTIKSYLKIKQHQQKIKQFSSSILEIDLKWLEYIIFIILIIAFVVSIFNIVYYKLPLNIYVNFIMLGAILFVAYNTLKQKEIFPKNKKHRAAVIAIDETQNEQTSTKRKIISDEDLLNYKSTLHSLMKEQQLFLNSDINVAVLSEHMQISTHQLSYIINNGFNQNFFQFINSYRIEKAKELLLDISSDKLSILGIAFESGFSSKTAFNTTFKKFTNQTPSEFKKQGSNL